MNNQEVNQKTLENDKENLSLTKDIIDKKTRGNAIVAYLFIFASWLLLFNKSNKYINNDFVKGHIKSAFLIHLGFLLTYLIFISYSLFSKITKVEEVLGLGLNYIVTDIIYIGLLTLMTIGIYKAHNGKTFKVSKKINISKQKIILDIDNNGKITEKEKLTIFISHIPFLGFIDYAKYKENKTIQNGIRLSIIISLTIIFLYIFGHQNLANILFLLYVTTIVFIGINLFIRDELIQIKLPEIFSPKNTYIFFISSKEYLLNYFGTKNFKTISSILKIKQESINKQDILIENILKDKKDFKLPKFLIYIPIINLIFIHYKNSKYNFHIINGIIITFLLSIISLLIYLGYVKYSYLILFLFPILFGIGYVNNNILAYRMPFIFDIYTIFGNIFSIFKRKTKVINKKRKEVNEVSLKVNQNNSNKEIIDIKNSEKLKGENLNIVQNDDNNNEKIETINNENSKNLKEENLEKIQNDNKSIEKKEITNNEKSKEIVL